MSDVVDQVYEEAPSSTAVAVSQQLMNIKPAEYVALVFEPLQKRLDAYKVESASAEYDIKTTAGMKTAIQWRAKGLAIRVDSKSAHKDRKAPILDIGRLLDGRLKEIVAEVEPIEDRFDTDIKGEERRKEAEKAAKVAAEQAHIAAIRAKIDAMRNKPASMVGQPSAEIGVAADHLSETVIALEEFESLTGEAVVERDHAAKKLREMQQAQAAVEQAAAEAKRQAEVDRLERERVTEQNRVEAARLQALAADIARNEQAARDAQAEQDRIAQAAREKADAEAQAIRDEKNWLAEKQRAEAQAVLDQKAADLKRQQEAADNLARINRETQERLEQERKIEAAHAEALTENTRIDAERAEQMRQQVEADARDRAEIEQAEEQARRDRINFAENGPGDLEIVVTLAEQFGVDIDDVVRWIAKFDHSTIGAKIAAAA